jgi:hypothetical protein
MKQDGYDAVMNFVWCRRCKCCPRDGNVEGEAGSGRRSSRQGRQFSDRSGLARSILFIQNMRNGQGFLSSDTLHTREEPYVDDDDDDIYSQASLDEDELDENQLDIIKDDGDEGADKEVNEDRRRAEGEEEDRDALVTTR